ncbi:MAG: alanine racemase [Cyclobacteriaceae bacterium]|jgi:D-serine deaminase-like pyridoxal phosphate-dependent protein|nr:alanine racemase [Cyclobacteriaceae bacterium]
MIAERLQLFEPTLLLDKQRCLANIAAMAERAKRSNVIFRPHFKTHQSHEVGRWIRNTGVNKITVSSVKMAEYFANDGWNDITVAFPVNVHEKKRINALAEKITLNLLVVSPEPIAWLAREVKHSVSLFIEIDTGQHRTGLQHTDIAGIDALLAEISRYPHLQFKGFLSHGGHSYKITGDRREIHHTGISIIGQLRKLKEHYQHHYPDLILSPGDTPTCSILESFAGADEIRPGNFVFYDYGQFHIGSCSLDQIAVALAVPVVAENPDRHEVVVHGGAVHLSKDSMLYHGKTIYGKVVQLTDQGWSTAETNMYVKYVSQEHGVIHCENPETVRTGDWLGILPVHSCLTADVMKAYTTLEGERIDMMR